jgi:hypothetical protein
LAWLVRSAGPSPALRARSPGGRGGRIVGFSLGNYLLLVDYTGRLFRAGKAQLSRELAEILDRLGTSPERWQTRLERLRQGRLLGRFFASTRKRLREVADQLGLRRTANLGG